MEAMTPLVDISQPQAETLKMWTTILSWASVVSATLCVVVNSLDKRKRSFPARLPLNFAIASLVYSLAIASGSLVSYGQLPNSYAREEALYPTVCTVQGVLVHYCANALTAWWLCISFTLYKIICRGADFDALREYEPLFHAFGWGWPLLLTIPPLSAGKIGAVQGCAWCQVVTADSSLWLISCFYAWMGLILIIGTFWAARTVSRLVKLRNLVRNIRRRATTEYNFIIVRQLYSVGIFGIVFVIVFTWGMVVTSAQAHGFLVPYWMCIVTMVAATSPGIDCFLLFGTTPTTFRFFRELLCGPQVANRGPGLSTALLVSQAPQHYGPRQRSATSHAPDEESATVDHGPMARSPGGVSLSDCTGRAPMLGQTVSDSHIAGAAAARMGARGSDSEATDSTGESYSDVPDSDAGADPGTSIRFGSSQEQTVDTVGDA